MACLHTLLFFLPTVLSLDLVSLLASSAAKNPDMIASLASAAIPSNGQANPLAALTGSGGNPFGSFLGNGGNPLGALTGGGNPLGSFTGGGNPLAALTGNGGNPLGAFTGGGGNPLGGLTGGVDPLGAFTGGGNPLGGLLGGGDPLGGLLGGLSGGGGGNPLEAITGLFGGTGGTDLLGILTGGLGGSGGTDLLGGLFGGSADSAQTNVNNMFTPVARNQPAIDRGYCYYSSSAADMQTEFRDFLPGFPEKSTRLIFDQLNECQKKKDTETWGQMTDLLEGASGEMFPRFTDVAVSQCRYAVALEEKRCDEMRLSMCNLLSGASGLEANSIVAEMKRMAHSASETTAAEQGCKGIERVLSYNEKQKFNDLFA